MENEIKHNVPIEVTKIQYIEITKKFNGIVAHRTEIIDGEKHYYIKIMLKKYIPYIEPFLK